MTKIKDNLPSSGSEEDLSIIKLRIINHEVLPYLILLTLAERKKKYPYSPRMAAYLLVNEIVNRYYKSFNDLGMIENESIEEAQSRIDDTEKALRPRIYKIMKSLEGMKNYVSKESFEYEILPEGYKAISEYEKLINLLFLPLNKQLAEIKDE